VGKEALSESSIRIARSAGVAPVSRSRFIVPTHSTEDGIVSAQGRRLLGRFDFFGNRVARLVEGADRNDVRTWRNE
jgi:hypothetical protein